LDLQDRHIEGQFYNCELGKVTVPSETEFKIDKIVRPRNKGGIKHLFEKKGYDETFNSLVKASHINKI
jgi:hypothetical protein